VAIYSESFFAIQAIAPPPLKVFDSGGGGGVAASDLGSKPPKSRGLINKLSRSFRAEEETRLTSCCPVEPGWPVSRCMML
jgi:hypothetical protein